MEKLRVNIVIEILGRPPEHVKESLNTLLERLGSEKGVAIIEKNQHEPIPKENSKDFFTTFAELTLELESIRDYLGVLFAYMPSHIEIVQPEKINFTNTDFNDLGNKLAQRLHDYDAITKKALFEKDFLTKKLQEVAPELFNQEPKQKEKKKTKKSKSKSK